MKQEFSDTAEEIKRTSDASISTEGHKALWELAYALWFPDALEVDHANVELLELVHEGHVVVLCLDCMGEEEVRLAWQQVCNWHFLYAEDDGRVTHVLLDDGTGVSELILTVASDA